MDTENIPKKAYFHRFASQFLYFQQAKVAISQDRTYHKPRLNRENYLVHYTGSYRYHPPFITQTTLIFYKVSKKHIQIISSWTTFSFFFSETAGDSLSFAKWKTFSGMKIF